MGHGSPSPIHYCHRVAPEKLIRDSFDWVLGRPARGQETTVKPAPNARRTNPQKKEVYIYEFFITQSYIDNHFLLFFFPLTE